MYNEKQLRMWLMIIPFLVMHILGSHSLFSMYGLFNAKNNSFYFQMTDSCEDITESVFSDSAGSQDIKEMLDYEKPGASMLKDVFKGLRRQQKKMSADEIFICDNRIDKVNKKYSRYLCKANVYLTDSSPVSVV